MPDLGTPHQFVADGREEVLLAGADEVDIKWGALQMKVGSVVQGDTLRVDAEGIDGGLFDGEGDASCVGHDDGAQGEGMGRDGGDDEALRVGCKDRSAAGERVGGGTRGGGHDDTVAGIGGHIVAIDIDAGAEQRVLFAAVDEHLVEGEASGER